MRDAAGTSSAVAELPTGYMVQPSEYATAKQSMPTASIEGRAIRLCRHFSPASTAQGRLWQKVLLQPGQLQNVTVAVSASSPAHPLSY